MHLYHVLSVLVMTSFLIWMLKPLALKVGFIDHPNHRKQHNNPTPLIGGLSIFLVISAFLLVVDDYFPHQLAFILALSLLVVVGLIDDYKGLRIRVRLIAQIGAVLIMTQCADLKITNLGDLVGLGNIDLGLFETVFTVFAVVGGMSAFNMIDGIDGLAGSLSLIAFSALAIISWVSQDLQLFNLSSLFIAAIIGFLIFNLRIFGRKSALIFLGDTGSTILGFSVCWLSIYASQSEHKIISPSLVLWIIAVPLIDSICIMFRRISKGRSPFSADREHLHHILHLAGYHTNQILIIIIFCASVICTVGFIIEFSMDVPESTLFFLFSLMLVSYYWCMCHAWSIMKIARYIGANENRGNSDKRKAERRLAKTSFDMPCRRKLPTRRIMSERRYKPKQHELIAKYNRERKIKNIDKINELIN